MEKNKIWIISILIMIIGLCIGMFTKNMIMVVGLGFLLISTQLSIITVIKWMNNYVPLRMC